MYIHTHTYKHTHTYAYIVVIITSLLADALCAGLLTLYICYSVIIGSIKVIR